MFLFSLFRRIRFSPAVAFRVDSVSLFLMSVSFIALSQNETIYSIKTKEKSLKLQCQSSLDNNLQ